MRGAEEGKPGSPSKRLKIARQMSLGTVLRHVESQGQARGSLDSHVGAKPITVEDMTGEGPGRKCRKGVPVALVESILLSLTVASHCHMLFLCCFMTLTEWHMWGVAACATTESKQPFLHTPQLPSARAVRGMAAYEALCLPHNGGHGWSGQPFSCVLPVMFLPSMSCTCGCGCRACCGKHGK